MQSLSELKNILKNKARDDKETIRRRLEKKKKEIKSIK